MRTHYEVLGVAEDASAASVRDAYRRLAREHHPDRRASSAAGGASMPEINEAYRVLSDPGRRAMYDASRRTAPGVPPGEPPVDTPVAPMHPSHLAPARIPWRSSLVVFVVAAIGIIVLAQFTEPGEPPGPDGILRVGDCIEVERENFAREVACTGDVEIDVRVAAFVAFDAPCPGVTERYQDRQGMGVACVERP